MPETSPSDQVDENLPECWECGKRRPCYDHFVACTGMVLAVCEECLAEIERRSHRSGQSCAGGELDNRDAAPQ
ncbi:MAG TPA: hypothetical protein PLV92_23055 [Pirellulaceae bacterium]|nr:hypothetical protein [Pirellulaceae bacterium]